MKKLLFLGFVFCMMNAGVVNAETVVFNTQTHKIHKPYCKWAKKCTVNCIQIEKSKAKARGGVPCKVCGG